MARYATLISTPSFLAISLAAARRFGASLMVRTPCSVKLQRSTYADMTVLAGVSEPSLVHRGDYATRPWARGGGNPVAGRWQVGGLWPSEAATIAGRRVLAGAPTLPQSLRPRLPKGLLAGMVHSSTIAIALELLVSVD